ncbi:MAG: hypothetical protein FOGNACKC_05107 [Anaerolineae bacterium]|nr:hypothetical protein [Anaerolineae bacterium]
MRLLSRTKVIGLLLALALLPAAGGPASAHPLDEFYQVTFLTVGPDRVSFVVELYTGVLVAPQVLALIDTDADDRISEAEAQGYIDRFLADVTFQIDGVAAPLHPDSHEFSSPLDMRAGVGVLRMFLHADIPPAGPGQRQLFYKNNHAPVRSVYVVSAISENPEQVQLAHQQRDVLQQSLALDFAVTAAASAAGPPPAAQPVPVELPTGAPTAGQKWLTDYLYRPNLSPWLVGLVLAVSVVLGGAHALTPGHGKTLVAAYLIGSRGTVGHAITLGGIVTVTHTASVIVIGLLALLASRFIVPNVLAPALEVLSGLLVVWIGGQLIWNRWREYRRGEADHHDHDHHHHHDHDHHGRDHHHDHDHHGHAHHHHELPDRVSLRDLLALGISGGLVPCPEALGIMLIAVGLNRILLGLGMVVAFSFGLAVVLIVIGILLVRAKSLLDGVSRAGQRWQTLLPLFSAVLVTLLGLAILLKGLWPYLAG